MGQIRDGILVGDLAADGANNAVKKVLPAGRRQDSPSNS
jgi:hypothetical protein